MYLGEYIFVVVILVTALSAFLILPVSYGMVYEI